MQSIQNIIELLKKIKEFLIKYKEIVVPGVLGLLLLTFSYYFGIRYFINYNFLRKYEQEAYEELNEEALFSMNWIQSYLPYYNSGNAAYQNGDYVEAEEYFFKALKENPPHKTEDDIECKVRVNLALSTIHQIDFDHLEEEQARQDAISLLLYARDILTETDCAGVENDEGHNEDARQLKKEIDEMLEELTEHDENDDSESDSDDDQKQNDNKEDQKQKEDKEEEKPDTSSRENKLRRQLEEERGGGYEQARNHQNQYNSGPTPGQGTEGLPENRW